MSIKYNISIGDVTKGYLTPCYEMGADHLGEINNRIKASYNINIRRGDVVWIDCFRNFRNEGVMIYDGDTYLPLAYEYYKYGYIPSSFTINEFGDCDYWYGTINDYVWADFTGCEYTIDGEDILIHCGRTYRIVPSEDIPYEEYSAIIELIIDKAIQGKLFTCVNSTDLRVLDTIIDDLSEVNTPNNS